MFTSPASTPDILARICAETLQEVARRKASMTLDGLRARFSDIGPPRGFGRVLKHQARMGEYTLIAEIKKASPSGGLIREDFNPATLAKAYCDGGATCLSVLTDRVYFQGDPSHIVQARQAVKLPALRKDFILDPWQIYESRALGADCILLIMAALSNEQARELEALARSLDMDVLAEVHDRRELDRALGLQTDLIGINNRNLKTLQIDLTTTELLAPLVPPDRFLIAESGITSHKDVQRIARAGVLCFLVGESLMRQHDVAVATSALLGRPQT
jgi:indole-3-glycerol phosphate synthase